MNHSKKYIASGIIISNLIMIFAGAFIFPWYWNLDEFSGLFPMLLIILTTICSTTAGYFWSFTGATLKSLRLLAVVHLFWVWIVLWFQPHFGLAQLPPMEKDIQFMKYVMDNYLYIFNGVTTFFIILFCSLLGNWFGRRFFYE